MINSDKVTIGFFGSCRLQDILKTIGKISSSTNFPINPYLIGKVAGFTHTTKETIQLINYLDGIFPIPNYYKQLIYRPAFFLDNYEKRIKSIKNGRWRECDLYLIEITSLKIFQVEDNKNQKCFYLNKNTLDNFFNDFLNDNLEMYLETNNLSLENYQPKKYNLDLITGYYRFNIQRKSKGSLNEYFENEKIKDFHPMIKRIEINKDSNFKMTSNLEELKSVMNDSYNNFQQHLDIIKKVKYHKSSKEEIKNEISQIKTILNKPFIIVTHYDYNIPKRKELIDTIKQIGEELNIPVFDPSPYIISPKDVYHYSSSDLHSIAPHLYKMIKDIFQ